MGDFWLNLGISAVLTALSEAFKNPVKKEALKKAMLKIAGQIQLIYGADVGFNDDLRNAVVKAKGSL